MKIRGQILALLTIFTLSEVNSHGEVLEQIRNKISGFQSNENDLDISDERGLLNLLRPRPVPALPPAVLPPAIPVPPAVPATYAPHVHNRPSILNLLPPLPTRRPFGSLFAAASGEDHGINFAWIKYAFQKCAKVDPRQLTAVFPTSTNNLKEPKMYYFENSTSSAKTWFGAQEWCSSKGMQLVSVNSVDEHNVLKAMLVQILAGTTPVADATVTPNPDTFWIGLNNHDATLPFTYIGDSTATYTTWHTGEPASATHNCGAYTQFTSSANINMDAKDCTATNTYRYICELSDECTSLLMSRYPTHYHVHHGIPIPGK